MMGASVFAQDEGTETPVTEDTTQVATEDVAVEETATEEVVAEVEEESGLSVLHTNLKTKFIEGGAGFMGAVLLTLILGLALCFERIIYLSLASTNVDKLLLGVEEALDSGGVEAAKEICRNTRGPVASIFYQGLDRADQGIDVVEKSVVSYGSVQMGLLEKNSGISSKLMPADQGMLFTALKEETQATLKEAWEHRLKIFTPTVKARINELQQARGGWEKSRVAYYKNTADKRCKDGGKWDFKCGLPGMVWDFEGSRGHIHMSLCVHRLNEAEGKEK